jgi:hypothetical protein
VNPDMMHGWGNRPFDWQWGVTLQQEILPRFSVDVSFNRRWWSNFYVTDNQALGPATSTSSRLRHRLPGEPLPTAARSSRS